jgi:hypothetical protein
MPFQDLPARPFVDMENHGLVLKCARQPYHDIIPTSADGAGNTVTPSQYENPTGSIGRLYAHPSVDQTDPQAA